MLSKVALKNTDLNVSQLCYGTNQFGTAINQKAADAILDRFALLGGNFVDTARSYGDWIPDAPKGASERTIGAWLKGKKREDFVIATKGGFFDMRVEYLPLNLKRCLPDSPNGGRCAVSQSMRCVRGAVPVRCICLRHH